GGWTSSCTLALQPVTTRAEVPLVVETGSSGDISDPEKNGGDWTFKMSPTSAMDTVAVGEFVNELDVEKATLVVEKTDFGLGSAEAYKSMFKQQGVDVTGTLTFDQNAQNFRDIVTKAVGSGSDTWAVTTEVEQLSQIMKEARGQGSDA